MHLRYDRTELAHHREMLFTGPGAAEFISGVILQDETEVTPVDLSTPPHRGAWRDD